MLAEHKRLSYIGIGLGSIVLIIGIATGVPWLSILLQLAGIVLFIWGCCQYSMAKGYGWGWGLLGIWWLLGLIILLFYPDRHKSTEARRMTEKARPPDISPSVQLLATGLFLVGGAIHEILMWRTVEFDFTNDTFLYVNFQYFLSIEYFLAGGLFVAFLFLRLLRYASSENGSSPLILLVLGALSGIFATF